MAEQLEVLPELVVEDSPPPLDMPPPISSGSAFGVQQNIENEYSWPTWYLNDQGQVVNEAFAPPVPEVLPEVVVTAPKPAPPPGPTIAMPAPLLGGVVGALPGAVIVGAAINWAMEQFRRPDVSAERPVYVPPVQLEVLPEVQVVATRPPRPPTSFPPLAMPADPWPFNLDPLEYYPELPGQRPLIPLPGGERRPAPVRIGDPRVVGAPGVDPEIEPAPAPRPGAQPSPRTPQLVPTPAPGVDAGPSDDFSLEPFPRFGVGPGPGASPEPYFPAFPDPLTPDGIVPSGPGETARPPGEVRMPEDPLNLFGAPDPLADPVARPPGEADRCSCAQQKPKKKRKREPRKVCYRGTFTETSKSLRKVRREQIPCT